MFNQFASGSQATLVASVGSVHNTDLPICKKCWKSHGGECRVKTRACFHCGSLEHRIKECPFRGDFCSKPLMRLASSSLRGRKTRPGNYSDGNRNELWDTTLRSEGWAPVRTYVIRAKEKAAALDVIAKIVTLTDTTVIALVDPGFTNSYICTT